MVPRAKAELRALNVIAPEYAKAVESDPLPKPAPGSDFFALRAHRANLLKERRHLYPIPGPVPEVNEELRQIPVRDGATIDIKLYTPASAPANGSPLIVMYHEGGWMMGDLSDEDQNCRLFSRDLGAVCVNVDYRLAPEHPFPKGIEDSWDALRWTAANASSLGADPSKGFIIGGASAGGNISAVLAHLARDENLQPPLTGQYLCVPAICPPPAEMPEKYRDRHISLEENVHDPVINRDIIGTVDDLLRPDPKSELYAPLLWPSGHRDLPRTYFQVGGLDPLRDEALIYDEVLKEASVETRCEVYKGLGHMFWTNFPKMKESEAFVNDTLEGFKWLLSAAAS